LREATGKHEERRKTPVSVILHDPEMWIYLYFAGPGGMINPQRAGKARQCERE
jgi:hypothetical protein